MPYDSVRPPASPSDSTGPIVPGRGFLPAVDPLRELPPAFSPWDELAFDLPKLLVSGRAREFIERLPLLDAQSLGDERELRRAMLVLSFLAHGYVWQGPEASPRLPACLARPFHAVAQRLGRPPVLSYASYALDNWRRLDEDGPIALGNLALLQNFLGGADEEWFITVHIDIEAKAAPLLAAVEPALRAAAELRLGELTAHLSTVAEALEAMHATLARTPEWCDPHTYYLRVRPYIHGWKNHPALPDGVVYAGVEEYAGQPQRFRGETGAQSSIVPTVDALLGIAHYPDPLREYLMEMRSYMPPAHRAFMEGVESAPGLREVVLAHAPAEPALREAYDACVHWVQRFRSLHLEYAGRYIHSQAQKDENNPTNVGTGGTPFMVYLKKHRDETEEHRVEGE